MLTTLVVIADHFSGPADALGRVTASVGTIALNKMSFVPDIWHDGSS